MLGECIERSIACRYECDAGTLFGRLITTSCGHLRSLADVSSQPDICDDTFLLAGRGLAYCPLIVLTPRALPTLLDSAIAGILVQHKWASCLFAL